jgi:hypothetical protein
MLQPATAWVLGLYFGRGSSWSLKFVNRYNRNDYSGWLCKKMDGTWMLRRALILTFEGKRCIG